MDIIPIASSSAGNCYIIQSGDEKLLIDCGVPLKRIKEALNYDLSNVVGCLISHEHKDHCKALPEMEAKTVIPAYGPDGIKKGFKALRYNTIENMAMFSLGTEFYVRSVKLEHDVECFGYIIKARSKLLFYATDTGSIKYKIPGITHLMIEANHSIMSLMDSDMTLTEGQHIADRHLDIQSAVNFAENHKDTLEEIHLIHLSDRHSDEISFKKQMVEAVGVPVYVAPK